MILSEVLTRPTPSREALQLAYRRDETEAVEMVLAAAALTPDELGRIDRFARAMIAEVRAARSGKGGIDAFLHQYQLSTTEGAVLMCLAEALLRIPDAKGLLINNRIGVAYLPIWDSQVDSALIESGRD